MADDDRLDIYICAMITGPVAGATGSGCRTLGPPASPLTAPTSQAF
jgi:hypothetical protein